MASFNQLLLCSASALAFTLSCSHASSQNSVGPVPIFRSAEAAPIAGDQSDSALMNVRRLDESGRTPDRKLPQLSAEEHLRRAAVYHANRAFSEAREHWQAVISRYPDDPNVSVAYFGIGRSLFQERRYTEALPVFQKLGDAYPTTEAGRDGFYYVAATLLRLGRPAEAATRYGEYTIKFPQGERIEQAHLNAIDSWREAGRPEEALTWIARTRERFAGKPTGTNALFARLRLDIARADWQSAAQTSDELSRAPFARGVMTTLQEVSYLRAYSLERAGKKEQAIKAYQLIPDSLGSYYGGLATSRLAALGGEAKRIAAERTNRVRAEASMAKSNYPTPFRETLLRAVKGRALDPRLILAIMKQESSFNPRAKSPAAARGLMQLTIDTAAKYSPRVNLTALSEDDLYRPEVSIPLAGEYLAELSRMFPARTEAVIASYNGGEDNVARWVKRAVHADSGVFTSEVGFTESKDYVFKVMANYRAYQQLYTEDLRPRF